MKIKVEVCELCRNQKCDGKLYELKDRKGNSWLNDRIFCKNSEDIVKKNNNLYYHWVMGHGIEDNLELIEFKGKIKYTDKYNRGFKKKK